MTQTRKRIRKLSTAVFRGSRSEYNFDVYPITTAITDNAAVFIFSKRKVDRKGHAHHAVSCAGETQSIVSEIKKHKRARCIKGNGANVVCILREADRKARSGVLDDITSARAFSCVRGKFKPTIKAKLDVVKNDRTAKILPFKPISKANAAATDTSRPVVGRRKAVNAGSKADTRRSEKPKSPKKGEPPAGRTRVSSGVDSDRGQHRLPVKKRTTGETAKTRIAGGPRTRTKLAA